MKSKKRKGIILVTALIISTVIMMFIGAALALAPGSLTQTKGLQAQDAAERAALCGVDYILSRISLNPNYAYGGGGQTGPMTVMVDEQDMYVVEEKGNIVGLMWDRDTRQVSQFRIRFNYQDGRPVSQTEKLADPSAAMHLDLGFISKNNTANGSNINVPKVTGSGYSVVGGAPTLTVLPARCVYVAVEGRAGQALSTLTKASPNAALGYGPVTTRVVESMYKVALNAGAVTDAAMMGRGDVNIQQLQPAILESANSIPGRVRAGESLTFKNKGANTAGVVQTPDQKAQLLNPAGDAFFSAGSAAVQAAADTGTGFYKLAWTDIPAAPATASKLPAGTYVVDQSGKLTYYDMSHGEYIKQMKKATPPTGTVIAPANLPAGVTFTNTGTAANPNYELKISQDVLVEPTAAGTNDFAFMPKRGAPAGKGFSTATADTNSFTNYFSNISGTTWKRDSNYYSSQTPGPIGVSLRSVAMSSIPYTSPGPVNGLGSGVIQFSVAMGSGNTATVSIDRNGRTLIDNLLPAEVPDFLSSLYTMFPDNPSNTVAQSIETFQEAVGGSIGLGGDVNTVPGELDPVTTEHLTLNITPSNGKSATLTGPAGVTVGANLMGNGGSVTSQGDINLFGFGVNLAANPNAVSGISLYAKKDINLSTYFQSAIDAGGNAASTGYQDVSLTGVVYAWGNVKVAVGDPNNTATWKDFNLTGTLVSYGGDPAGTTFDSTDISILARQSHLKFDSTYLLNLMSNLPAVGFTRLSYAIH